MSTDQHTELRRSIAFCEEEIRREPLVIGGRSFQFVPDPHCHTWHCVEGKHDLAFGLRTPWWQIVDELEWHACKAVMV